MGERANSLLRAVEELYRTFATSTPPIIEGCPCCIETRGVDVLLATPLRELTGLELWRYVSGLFYTIGSVRDYRYFLPRIMEIATEPLADSNNPEIVLHKLSLAGWDRWPDHEREAIERFIYAWFAQAVAADLAAVHDGDVPSAVESILCGCSLAGMPITPMLAAIDTPATAAIAAHLTGGVDDGPFTFWKDAPTGVGELRSYFSKAQS